MLVDRSHRGWAIFFFLVLLVASLLYVVYARTWPNGPSGRTWPGMLFGVVGTLLMIFAGFLSLRKKTVSAHLGSLSWWLKGHLWLGLLSVPMIFFHSAFRWGGWVEILLWVSLAVVITSGLLGLAMQNIIPRAMKLQLPNEAIPDQFAEVCRRLILSADEKVTAQCTPAAVQAVVGRAGEMPTSIENNPLDWLASFYINSVRPFLGPLPVSNSLLATREQAELVFERLRASLPDTCHLTVDWLEQSCHDRRQLAKQERLHGLLHSWLKIHIPFSVAILVFTVIHVISAIYY